MNNDIQQRHPSFTYTHKTNPYGHQSKYLQESWDKEYYGIFWEMGTGKSKLIVDNFSILYMMGKIDSVLILAPKGMYSTWARAEIPKHLPDNIVVKVTLWSSYRKKITDTYLNKSDTSGKVLDIAVMNIEAMSMGNGKFEALDFIKSHESTFMVIDESTTIKSPSANRTKVCLKLGEKCSYRRVLSGYPVTQSPLDLYSQSSFLKKGLLGFTTFSAFRAHHAIIVNMRLGTRTFPKITGYRNLNELKNRLKDFSSRVTKKECLDLPEKIFTTVHVEMTPEQIKMYDDIKQVAVAEMEGATVSVTSALTALIKLQQITCGHCKMDGDTTIMINSGRIAALKNIIESMDPDEKCIIWCKFVMDVKMVGYMLTDMKETFEEYYGATSKDQRDEALDSFKEKEGCRFLVATSAAARGLTLVECATNIYYSLDYNLEMFMQSQDRTHRIGQTRNVNYVMMVATGTVDENISKALKEKRNIAEDIMSCWKQLLA